MISLADLRALVERALTHTENPAIVRLTDRTVEGVAGAYLPRAMAIQGDAWTAGHYAYQPALLVTYNPSCVLDLTDPGTAHALLVALALALGLDPGVGGLNVKWHRSLSYATNIGWHLIAAREWAFLPTAYLLPTRRDIQAPTVAAEPDPIKAIVLAARYVLENP